MLRRTVVCLAFAWLSQPVISHAGSLLFGRLQPTSGESNAPSTTPDVSGNGKIVAFETSASNWVTPTFVGPQIVAFDLSTGSVDIVSRNGSGVNLNGNVFGPALSDDGRYVAFETQATNLSVPVSFTSPQIVRKNRSTGAFDLVSVTAAGSAASGSASGQARDVSMSADGRYVAFRSDAANLITGDTAGTDDVFVKDMSTGALQVVSLTSAGTFAGASATVTFFHHGLSGDGRYVVLTTNAANMTPGAGGGTLLVYARDRVGNANELISTGSSGAANSQSDYGAISPNGRFVSFRSFASNLGGSGGAISRVYVRDRQAGTTSLLPMPSVNGNVAGGCRESDVSDIGTVLYTCFFPNGIFDQVFLHIPGSAGTPFLVSSDINDVAGTNASGTGVALNANGLSMAFDSRAPNLIAGDNNSASDIFVLFDPGTVDVLFANGFE